MHKSPQLFGGVNHGPGALGDATNVGAFMQVIVGASGPVCRRPTLVKPLRMFVEYWRKRDAQKMFSNGIKSWCR